MWHLPQDFDSHVVKENDVTFERKKIVKTTIEFQIILSHFFNISSLFNRCLLLFKYSIQK